MCVRPVAGAPIAEAGDVSGSITQNMAFTASDTTTELRVPTVQAGATLPIGAGATVESTNNGLIVQGPLTATVTSDQPIIFHLRSLGPSKEGLAIKTPNCPRHCLLR